MSILDIVLCVAVAVLSWTTYAGWTYRRALTSRTWTDTGVSDLSGEGDLTWTLDPAVCDETDWVEYRRTPTAPRGDEAPRELLCMICGCNYATWFAPNDLWNWVMRAPDGNEESETFPFVCPTCFTMMADVMGVEYTAFVVSTEGSGGGSGSTQKCCNTEGGPGRAGTGFHATDALIERARDGERQFRTKGNPFAADLLAVEPSGEAPKKRKRSSVIPIMWATCTRCEARYDEGNAMAHFDHIHGTGKCVRPTGESER